jgi:hypothetical protein
MKKVNQKNVIMKDVEASFLAQREVEERESLTDKYVTEDWENAGAFWWAA